MDRLDAAIILTAAILGIIASTPFWLDVLVRRLRHKAAKYGLDDLSDLQTGEGVFGDVSLVPNRHGRVAFSDVTIGEFEPLHSGELDRG